MRKRNPGGLRPSGAFLVFIYTDILVVMTNLRQEDNRMG